MNGVGNIGPMPLPKVATRDGARQGGDAPADKNAFHSILARLGNVSSKGTASGTNDAEAESDGEVGTDKVVAKALHAAKDRSSQEVAQEPLLAQPSGSVGPAIAPAPTPTPSVNLDVPLSVPDDMAAAGDKLRQPPETRVVVAKTPQVPPQAVQPSSPTAGSDQIALRVVGTAPIAWRQDANAEAPLTAAKPAERNATSAPVTAVRASVVATETHLAPIAAVSPPAAKGLPAKVGKSDDAGSEKTPAILTDDPDTGDAGGAHDKPRLAESSRALRPGRASRNSAERPVTLGADSTQQLSPADSSGLPRAALASVADAVVTAANRLESATPVAASAAVPSVATGEVRTMTVRLDLPEHGGVNLRVSLKGNALSLNLTADRDDTAKRLSRDQDALTNSLRDNGYDTDIRAIDVGRPDAPSSSRDAAGVRDQNSATTGSGSGQPGAEQRPTEPRQQDRGGRAYRGTDLPQETTHEKNKPDDSRGRGLYV
jgi:hypothetical protein